MTKVVTKEELLAKAKKPAADAMELHPFYRGKIETTLKCCVRDFNDFAIWYTPGVAAPCKAIQADPELVYQHTNKWNTVAVVSDGTRVLGLGDIGPKAGMPVMEGKSLLYKYLGGVDGFPLMVDTKDPDKIIETRQTLATRSRRRQPRRHFQPEMLPHPRHPARTMRNPRSGTTINKARRRSRSPVSSTRSKSCARKSAKSRSHLSARARRTLPSAA